MYMEPSSFRRSTEHKVTDPNEAAVVKAERRRDKERQAFEEIGFSAGAATVLVEPLDRHEKGEQLVDAMAAENYETFDIDGWVR